MADKKRWFPMTYESGNLKVTAKLKRLTFEELAPLDVGVLSAYSVLPDKQEELEKKTLSESLSIFARYHAALEKGLVSSAFADYVKDVTVIEAGEPLTLDGEAIETGAQLYEIAAGPLVMHVLNELRSQGRLSEAEGKASGSPSPSSATQEPTSSDSPAPSIDAEVSPAP